tara:strand:+ start:48 stop:2495 length:2448 start_codon:yes stop_codon:yes gene_type:complete
MPIRLLTFSILISLFISLLTPVQAKTNNILVLHSYHQGLQWTDNITQGIQSILPSEENEIYYQYLDTKRNTGKKYDQSLIEFFQSKKDNTSFDLVIVADNNALQFVKKYGKTLYPNAPIVFCGINNFTEDLIVGIEKVTGIVEDIDIQGTIELMLMLHPNTQEILFIHDQSTTWKATEKHLLQVAKHFKNRVTFNYHNDFSFDELEDDLAHINKNTLIYLLSFNRDKNNTFLSYRDGINLINNITKAPVYSSWDYYIGKGIVGGIITTGFFQGEQVAKLAVKILSGENINNIPIIKENINKPLFDFNIMSKFGIDRAQLPASSDIINAPPLFFEKLQLVPRWWMITIAITILLLFIKLLSQKRNQLSVARINKKLDILVKNKTEALNETSEKLNTLLDTLPSPIFYKDTASVYQMCNDAFAKTIIGLPKEKISGHSLFDLPINIPTHLAKIYHDQDRQLINNPGVQLYEAQVKCTDGTVRDYMFHKATLNNSSGKISGIVGAMFDITDRKKSEQYLKESEERFFSLQEASFEGIAIHNGGIIIDTNQRFSEMTGYSHTELLGMNGFMLFSVENKDKVLRNILSDNKSIFETEGIKKNGLQYPIEIRSRKITFQGEMARVVVIRDLTEQKQAQQEREQLIVKLEQANQLLQSLATTDALTGLFNRGYISQRYTKEINKAQRYGTDFTIVMMDIDNFKRVNDTYGHPVGDFVLQRVSQTIQDCVRESDRVGRYGGEEFLILLPNTNLNSGYQLANRIRDIIENTHWEHTNMKVTISGGVAQYQGESETALLKAADTLLYCAKSQGRNRIIPMELIAE